MTDLPCRTQQIKLLGEMVEGEGEANQMEVGAKFMSFKDPTSGLCNCEGAMTWQQTP